MLTTNAGTSGVSFQLYLFSRYHVECFSEYLFIVHITVIVSLLVLLELIAKNGFASRQGGHSDFSGVSGPRQRQTNSEDTRPEEKPSDTSKSYTADQLDAVRR